MELLEAAKIRVASAITTIVQPLRIIRDAYQEVIAKGLIVVAIEQVVSLVSTAINAPLALISPF